MAPDAPPPIHAVFLDAGHTLVRAVPNVVHHYAAAAREVAGVEVSPDDLAGAFAGTWETAKRDLFAPVPGRRITDAVEHDRWRAFNARVFAALGVTGCDGPLWERLRNVFGAPGTWEPYEDTRPVLDALRDRGLRLAVVSNWSTALRPILAHHDLLAPFDVVLGSCEIGVEKPDPEIFRLALRALGVEPGEAIHVGDSFEADVLGARAAGVRGLLLDRASRHPERTDRIESLLEVLDLVDGRGR